MKRLCLVVFTLLALVLFTADLKAQGESEFKKEIRSDVQVDNPGTITGTVTCRRVRHSGDAIVYIEKVGDNKYDAPAEHGIVDQIDLVFIPHVIAVQKGTTIDFPNNDQVRHNVFSPPDCCKQFNLGTYDIGASKPVTFDKSCEVPLLCNVHAEMSAYVVVVDNPYFGVTAKNGSFTINNVPPGTYKLKTWHEKLKTVEQDVTVEGGKVVGVSFTLKKRK
jgi:plastocyanin